MHHTKLALDIRLLALLAVTIAVLLAASSLATPRQASATYTGIEGVMCFELVASGVGIGLVRIDDLGGGDITFTSQVYLFGGTDLPSCQQIQGEIPEDAVPAPAIGGSRTVLDGIWTPATHTLTADACQVITANTPLPGDLGTWTKVLVDFELDPNPAVKSSGTYETRTNQIPEVCGDTGSTVVLAAIVPDSIFLAGAPLGTANTNSNWDKDKLSDWDELHPDKTSNRDPFKDQIDLGVGGIAELAESAGTPLAASDSSGSNMGLIAGIVAAIAAGAVTLGGAAWYTKRRSIQ